MIAGEQRGRVTVLTLEHRKANALDTELCRGLTSALDELVREGAPAAVLTGSGSIFSAGVDLFQVVDGGREYVNDFLPALAELFRAVIGFPRPLVAAVNGHAIAGGCVLACGCDHRLGAGGGRIGVPELKVGVPFPTLAFEMVRTAAPKAAWELVTSGRTLPLAEAVEMGLLDRTVEPEELLDEACGAAETLAELPAEAFALTKAQRWAPALEAERDNVEREARVRAAWSRPETLERIRRYMESLKG